MAGIIEIRYRDERGILTVELKDLLAFFDHEGPTLIWSIQDLEAVGDPDKLKIDVLEIEKLAKESPQGFVLRWQELVELAQTLTDVWNAWIVACSYGAPIPKAIYKSEKVDQFEAVIEAFDSSFWRVFARDHSIIHRIASKFHDVRVTQIMYAD